MAPSIVYLKTTTKLRRRELFSHREENECRSRRKGRTENKEEEEEKKRRDKCSTESIN